MSAGGAKDGSAEGPTTPARPSDAGSRQQTHPDQGSQSGSHSLDRELTSRGARTTEKPPGAK